MNFSEVVLDKSVSLNNNFLENKYYKIILLLFSGVFMGYTLQPVPKWLNKLFDTSYVFKFLILFINGSIALYPLNKDNIIWLTLGCILTLIVFEGAREIDKKIDEQNKEN
jgi:hypothetical protein